MPLTSLQSSTTKSAAFNGSSIDVSTLPKTGNVVVRVTSLPADKEAQIQLQSSEDGFTADIKVERQSNFVGPITKDAPVTKTHHEYDMPNIRLGDIPAAGTVALVSAPGTVTPTPSASGGTLSTGTKYWKVTALNAVGETIASAEASAAITGPTGSCALAWTAVTGATSYRVYRGTSPGGESVYFTTGTNSFTDTGAAGTAGTPPTSNTTRSEPAHLRVALTQLASSGPVTYEAYLQN